jgi:hypothetical protein
MLERVRALLLARTYPDAARAIAATSDASAHVTPAIVEIADRVQKALTDSASASVRTRASRQAQSVTLSCNVQEVCARVMRQAVIDALDLVAVFARARLTPSASDTSRVALATVPSQALLLFADMHYLARRCVAMSSASSPSPVCASASADQMTADERARVAVALAACQFDDVADDVIDAVCVKCALGLPHVTAQMCESQRAELRLAWTPAARDAGGLADADSVRVGSVRLCVFTLL